MGTVVWPSQLSTEIPATTFLGGYEAPSRTNGAHSSIQRHHHMFQHRSSNPNLNLGTLSHLPSFFHHPYHDNDDIVSWTPDIDIRETPLAFHIDVEIPGVADKASILIHLTSPRTLLVRGKAIRPSLSLPLTKNGAKPGEDDKDKIAAADANDDERAVSGQQERLIHSERKIGQWVRFFKLPHDTDVKSVNVRLEAGLLRICVLKPKDGAAKDCGYVEVMIDDTASFPI
jgi:HSP20 family molecular chaperone IbpA